MLLLNERIKTQCSTLELPGELCIPEGKYKIEKFDSPTKGKCFKVLNVPGRREIFIREDLFPGDKKMDYKGDILVGYTFENNELTASSITMELLLKLIPDTIDLYII
jgi:hypothetical protein